MLPSYSSQENLKSGLDTIVRINSIYTLDEINLEKPKNIARRTRLPPPPIPTRRDSRFRTCLLIGLLALQSIAVIGFFISIVVSLDHYISSTYDDEYQDMIGYLIIFTIATLFEVYIAIDSVWHQNAPQLLALCIFESLMCGFGTMIPRQITKAIHAKVPLNRINHIVWRLYSVPAIMCLTASILLWLSWFVASDFGWQSFKKLGANRQLRKAMIVKSVFFMLQKFNFFFLIGFCVLIVQMRKDDQGRLEALDIFLPSLALAIPFLVQFCASIAVELELPFFLFLYGIFWCIAMLFLGYEIIKLHPFSKLTSYQHSLILFSSLTVLLLFSTGLMSILCFRNFDKGLKEADNSSILRFFKKKINIQRNPKKSDDGEENSIERVILD